MPTGPAPASTQRVRGGSGRIEVAVVAQEPGTGQVAWRPAEGVDKACPAGDVPGRADRRAHRLAGAGDELWTHRDRSAPDHARPPSTRGRGSRTACARRRRLSRRIRRRARPDGGAGPLPRGSPAGDRLARGRPAVVEQPRRVAVDDAARCRTITRLCAPRARRVGWSIDSVVIAGPPARARARCGPAASARRARRGRRGRAPSPSARGA